MSYFDGKLQISVASASGIEAITKRELVKLGYEPKGAIGGRIAFDGTFFDVAKCNMFLRTAGRVRINIATFKAETFDELFDNIKSINWEDILPEDANIIVNGKSFKSILHGVPTIQRITKKAICERMKEKCKLIALPENGENFEFEISFIENVATISLDTSGSGLHKRGYRTKVGVAPLRETTAAAMVLNSFWNKDKPLLDVFTGSGTIPIESAMIATNRAPGLNRTFAFQNFDNAPDVIDLVRDEAEQLIDRNASLRISGFDIDSKAIKLANFHAKNAGVFENVHFQVSNMRQVRSKYAYGVLISNPPYGERLLKGKQLFELYRDFGKMYASLDEWSAYIITSCLSFEKHFGKKSNKKRTLYNSELRCNLYSYFGAKPNRNKNV